MDPLDKAGASGGDEGSEGGGAVGVEWVIVKVPVTVAMVYGGGAIVRELICSASVSIVPDHGRFVAGSPSGCLSCSDPPSLIDPSEDGGQFLV
jgi:hypothetical protein